MGWWLHFVASGALAGGVRGRDTPTAPGGRGMRVIVGAKEEKIRRAVSWPDTWLTEDRRCGRVC